MNAGCGPDGRYSRPERRCDAHFPPVSLHPRLAERETQVYTCRAHAEVALRGALHRLTDSKLCDTCYGDSQNILKDLLHDLSDDLILGFKNLILSLFPLLIKRIFNPIKITKVGILSKGLMLKLPRFNLSQPHNLQVYKEILFKIC